MNKDTGISIFTGQPILSATLSKDVIDEIKILLHDISNVHILNKYIHEHISENPDEWKLIHFTNFISYYEKNKSNINTDLYDLEKLFNDIKKLIRKENRFSHHESAFVQAMKEGNWVLFDGIESAPPEIPQKLSSLCDDDPEIHLIENGKDTLYTKKKGLDSYLINDNFHLFFTYNPSSLKENIYLDPTFFNKCVSFTLPPIDSCPEYSAQVLHGLLLKMQYKNDIATEIATRMSMAHELARNKSANKYDYFAGDLQFTGRTLKFTEAEFKQYVNNKNNKLEFINNFYIPVCNSFKFFYWNSEIKKDDCLKNEMIEEFSKPLNNDIAIKLNHKSDNYKIRNQDALRVLRSIQKYACKKTDKSDFACDFVHKCRSIKLSDIHLFIEDIDDTLKIIKEKTKSTEKINQIEHAHLKIILNILQQIDNFTSIVNDQLIDSELFNQDLLSFRELENPLLKLQLLEKLQENNFSIFHDNMPLIFVNEKLFEIFDFVFQMHQDKDINNFKEFVSYLCNNQDLIPYVESLFPYNLFENSAFETLNYLIPMFLNLYIRGVTFHVKIEEQTFHFIITNKRLKFEPTYVFGIIQNEGLILLQGTNLKNKISKKKKKKEISNATKSKTFYIFTMHTLNNKMDNPNKKTREEISKNIQIEKHEKSKIMNLFPKSSKSKSMIANVWSLIYTMTKDFENKYKNYFHPLEFDIISHFNKYFQILNKQNIKEIIELTNWMNNFNNLSFGDENSYLWKYSYDAVRLPKNATSDIERNIKLVEKEIKYLKSTPKVLDWSSENYITNLEKVKQQLQSSKRAMKLTNEQNEIIENINKIYKDIEDMVNKKSINSFYVTYFTKFVIYVQNNPTKELYNKCYFNFVDFKKMKNSKKNSQTLEGRFIWPFPLTKQISDNDYNDNIKLYEHILWYSQVFSLIEKISLKRSTTDLFNNFSDLHEKPNMEDISAYLMNNIFKNDNVNEVEIENKDIALIISTLNANFVFRLIKDNLFDKIIYLDKILNDLENRNSNFLEIQWANHILSQYPIDFQIVLPQFTPYDVFSLFVSRKDEMTAASGPLLKEFKSSMQMKNPEDKEIENSLFAYLNKTIKNDESKFEKYAVLVSIEIYKKFVFKDDNITHDVKEFKSFINEEIIKYESKDPTKISILKKILNFLIIAENMSKCSKFSFEFNDIQFLEKDWILNENFLNNYPSFLYWLSLNNDCLIQLQRNFESFKFSEKKLPFWLFIIRIISSKKCIQFYCKNGSDSAKLIKKSIESAIIEIFNNNKNIRLGTKWVNFLLPKVPLEIYNSNYRLFYQFFYNLSADNIKPPTTIRNIKEDNIKNIAINVTNMVFSNAYPIESFLNFEFKQKSANYLLSFIFSPQTFIEKKINELFNMIFSELKSNISFKHLNNQSKKMNEELNGIINQIRKQFDDENEKINEEYEKRIKNEKEKIRTEIMNEIEEYENYLNTNTYKIYGLFKNNKYLKDFQMDETKTPTIIDCDFDTYIGTFNQKKFYPIIKDDSTINKICSNKCQDIKKPYLIIDNESNFDRISNKWHEMVKKMNELINKINDSISKLNVNENTVFALKEIQNISGLCDQLKVTYSNNLYESNNNINLNYLKKLFLQIKIFASEFQSYIETEKILEKIKDLDLSNRQSIFDGNYQYDIPIPENKKILIDKSIFASQKNCDCLSTPFLSDENGSITCCFESLDCTIGPIIPSLYSENVSFNFISFIDPIKIEVLTKDEKYKEWFKPKDKIPEIEIVLPKATSEEQEIFDIQTDVIVSSPGLKSLTLQCTFHINVVPFIIYITCNEYPLSYNDKKIYLCTKNLLSDTSINFIIKNYKIKDPLSYKTQFESLEGNESQIPEKIIDNANNKFKIIVPKVDTYTRLHCAVNLKFSDSILATFIIDSVIIPFDFSFSLYDYNSRRYTNDNIVIYYSELFISKIITLNFKVSFFNLDLLNNKFNPNFKIFANFPSEFEYDKYIDENCKFNKDSDFKIKLKYTGPNISQNKYNKNSKYYVSLEINNVVKTINLQFDMKTQILDKDGELIHDVINKFDLTCVKMNDKWVGMNDISFDFSKLIYICSPFDYQLYKQVQIKYNNNDCSINNSKENIFVYINKYNEIDIREQTKSDPKNGLPFLGISNNEWYPVFNIYNSIDDWDYLEVLNENKLIANNKIQDFLYPKLFNITRNNNRNDFYNFVKMIRDIDIIYLYEQIKNYKELSCFMLILNKFPNIMYLNKTKTIDSNSKVIIKHNLIKYLYIVFKQKFNELNRNDFYLVTPILELKKKHDELVDEYYQISHLAETQYLNHIKNKKGKQHNLLSEIKCFELPPEEQQYEAYLYGTVIKPVNRDIKMEYVKNFRPNKNSISSKNINIKFPDIEKYKNININEMSIININEYYQTCITITRILPIFIINMNHNKNDSTIDDAFNNFVFLYNAFLNLQSKNRSIISQVIDEFKTDFSLMLGKFINAGMHIDKFIPKYIIYQNSNQDFISYPNKDEIYLQDDIWNCYNRNKSTNDNFLISQTSHFEKLNIGQTTHKKDIIPIKNPESETQKNNAITKKADISTNYNIHVEKFYSKNSSNNKNDTNTKKKEDNNEQEKIYYTINKKSIEINTENLDGIISDFSEDESIKASIERIKDINEKDNIIITEFTPISINPAFFKPPANKNINLSIKPLLKLSLSLSQYLIIEASNNQIPFSKICVNILVDCSSFISIENKLYNMLLICSLTNALDILLIPYSVAVFGDCNFKCIIKTFEDKHSPFELQKILDCMLVKRLCSNLPSAVKFGIDNMKHKSRNQRAIFTFTSGLDDQIRLTKSWAESIFTQDSLSFLFVFIKSKNLEEEEEKYLSTVWTNFETEVNGYKARSLVKVIPVDNKISSFNNFVEAFAKVMVRSDEKINSDKYSKPLFDVKVEFKNPKYFTQRIDGKNALFNEYNCIYSAETNILNNVKSEIKLIDESIYHNKLCQLIHPHSKKRNDDVSCVVKKFIEDRSKINQSSLETIFKLNKPSQLVLSSTGSEIDIIAVIMNMIKPIPDPYIYLEEKGGWIRNYGVSVIIDTSLSCFFNLSSIHTLLTIKTVLSSLAALDLPCFDLIISRDSQPIVLCSEVGTIYSLDQKSSIWEYLFSLLENPVQKSDLASAINTAYDIKRMRSKDYSSYLFVITDGLYEKSERNRIIKTVNNCVLSGTEVIGIGIGTYPKGIENLFPKVVYSPNPRLVMKCIASLSGDIVIRKEEKMPTIYPLEPQIEQIQKAFENIKKNENNPIYKELKDELNKIKHLQDAFRHYSNPEGDVGNAIKGFTNFNGKNAELYKKNKFSTQKILIVMLWSYDMNRDKENKALQKKYIYQNNNPNKKGCIKTAVEHFGISIDVVEDYKDAIERLTKQTKPGFCDYYAVWVICGPTLPQLSSQNINVPQIKYSNLVGQFNTVLQQFWKNKGSIVFFAEGGHLFYQVNLFLETNNFNFRIGGNHKGNTYLHPDNSNELKNKQTFNNSRQGNDLFERPTLSHNLGSIFEGVSIAYAEYDLEKLYPFIPFARDSEGGIISMFLQGNDEYGDIVIDCGYTKCFTNMGNDNDGTFRYIQNIAGFTMNMESHVIKGFDPTEWRPKAVNHIINFDELIGDIKMTSLNKISIFLF